MLRVSHHGHPAAVLSILGVLAGALQATTALGQGLDIGGIRVHLGEPVADALRSLSVYQVTYNESGHFWTVAQRSGQEFQFLGSISAEHDSIVSISKDFPVNERDVARSYTDALSYLHAHAQGNCVAISPSPGNDGVVHTLDVTCGLVSLIYLLPSQYAGQTSAASIQIDLVRRPN